ncbi:hypothetical protein [Hymenobacter cavernae]|uniref:Uncharacterized protein n=1 Tax=Hymenobacter cavernae TaxID=2044852 RepID=A0ABQ1UWI7_9BACT|nr:hypothetical protein [Hymenobacter cavernae]GGF27933.1 hypothetical protein GCM10011383_44540 [Hymenobacter cavernae]
MESVAYHAYLQDAAHGLTHEVEANGAVITCAYRPTDLLVAQDLAISRAVPAAELVDSLRRHYQGKTYCSLSLAQDGAEIENQFITNSTAYTNALAYLNTGIAADVFLVTPTLDSIPALASIYPRQYGTTGHSTVLLIFDTHQLDLSHGFHITFRGDQFNVGTLRFPFTASDLADLPTLRF